MTSTGEKPTQVTVSTTVTISGATKTFTATSETDTPGYELAKTTMIALEHAARDWINELRDKRF